MRGRITTETELRQRNLVDTRLYLEPVRGCELQCKHCIAAAPIPPRKFMDAQWLDRQLQEIGPAITKASEENHERPRVDITGRGNPLEHPKSAEIIASIQHHLPDDTQISAFWNLHGVPDEQTLIQRTNGLTELVLSLDGEHYTGIMQALKTTGSTPNSAVVLEHIRERIRWALEASRQNNFELSARLTGGEKERATFLKLLREVDSEGPDQKPTILVGHAPRNPFRGWDLTRVFGLILRADNRLVGQFLERAK